MEDIKAFSIAERALNLLLPNMPEDISEALSHTESVVFDGKPLVMVHGNNRLDALMLKEFFDRSVQIRDNGAFQTVKFEVVIPQQPGRMN